jgi:hypothetical protein
MYLKLKNDTNNPLLYSDTDSYFMQYKLPNELVDSNKLGLLKLDNIIKEGIFISPKFYALINDRDEIIMKSKGVNKNQLTLKSYEDLYQGKYLTFNQTVFTRYVFSGIVKIVDRRYTVYAADV